MPCNFAGSFYVKDIIDYRLQCEFLDKNNGPRVVEMNYFRPSEEELGSGPFKELQSLNRIDVGRVHFITGSVAIADGDFQNPALCIPTTRVDNKFQVTQGFRLHNYISDCNDAADIEAKLSMS